MFNCASSAVKKAPDSIKAAILVTFGCLLVALGFVGIFLPLLPTTPLLLLAALCFDRGSPRFHRLLLEHRLFGPPINDWNKNRIIRPRFKLLACVMIIGASIAVYINDSIPQFVKVFYFPLVVVLITFIVSRKSRS
jgi:uncharacterized membrane protein YbaN (DUF454 family)